MTIAALFLFAGILGSIAVARRSGILRHFRQLGRLSQRSVRTLARRGVSDWSKERATRILAIRMMVKSLTAGALLALIALPLLAMLALDPIAHLGTIDALADTRARLFILSMGLALAGFRYATQRLRLRQA
ncbi:hypothetical protein [Sphingomonas sp.]|uniref:hypothetical protein n=1 Tax=Sphingomonas sp. TaxID=28214 RepID=UPI001B2BD592|nr:hypothetical protein [Sphingomonas sp.]MBO9713615.1 hypothetical protein [Sphingomonas sp.]